MAEEGQIQNDWLLIPFYSNPELPAYDDSVNKFREFARNAREISGLKLAIVDDGSNLKPEDFLEFTDVLVQVPENQGKARALRHGLHALLEDPEINADFIIQYDGDGDQSFTDIPDFVNKLHETAGGDSTRPALVIGDRYSERLTTIPNPNSITYRQSLLIFFGSLAGQFGYEISDWVSGARGYSAEYARRFLEKSRSDRYGVEAEQLVIAYLEGAAIGRFPLSHSRPRDPNTERTKWLQNFDAYLLHSDELRARGKGNVVDIVEELTASLRNETDEFFLDLRPIGENTSMRFERQGTAYTAEIPESHRAMHFGSEAPFAIRKEAL